MKLRNAVSALMTAGVVAVMCAVTAPAHATTAENGTLASMVCPTGDLCLQPTNGVLVLVPSGQRRDFNPPLNVTQIVNRTNLNYCVEIGFIVYLDIPPAATFSGNRTVFGVLPGPVCPG